MMTARVIVPMAALAFACGLASRAEAANRLSLSWTNNLLTIAGPNIPGGKLAWSKDGYFTSAAGKAHASFVVMGQNLLMLTDSGQLVLLAADPKEARELGRAQVCGQNWCNPAYADGRLYLRDSRELFCVSLLP